MWRVARLWQGATLPGSSDAQWWAKANKKHREALTAGMRRIFGSVCKEDARAAFRKLADELEGKADKALETLENGLEDALAVMCLPEKYRTSGRDEHAGTAE